MVRLVSFEDAVEERVRFIEETPRAEIVERTMARLEAGEDPRDLIAAAALAVSRSCELPADHHGGPIHPVAGIHAVMGLTARLKDDAGNFPVLQCVALANKHTNLPSMGPAAMVAFDDLKMDVDAEKALKRLAAAIHDHEPRLAERAVTLACAKASRGQIMETLLPEAIKRNSLDDHYFLYCIYAFRALDAIGWEYGPILLRPAMRYLSRHHSFDAYGEFDRASVEEGIVYYDRFPELEALVETYGITPERVPHRTGSHEDAAIAALADEIGRTKVIADLPETIARAMGNGLSLEGTIEGISIGGGRVFLRSHSNNPFDVHIHTGAAARRYLIGFKEVSFTNKVMSLLGWPWTYEVRYLDATLSWDWQEGHGALEKASAPALLQAIETCVLGIEGYDVTRLEVGINELVAKDGVREAVRLAESYVRAGYDPEALFALTGRLVCREDASEMHAYKLQQAAYEEFRACRAPHNWVHAVSAVKQVAVAAPTGPHRVWPEIEQRLAA